jgi:hypothetical protein
MATTNTKMIVLNVVAALVSTAALAGAIKSLLFSPALEPCSLRYASSAILALERGGVVLTSSDLQAGLGGKDEGVAENVAIERIKDGPAAAAMRVALASTRERDAETAPQPGGMRFPWEPRAIAPQGAACLAYWVRLPADFEFRRGGLLPGILGGDGAGDGFAALLVFDGKGYLGVNDRITRGGESRTRLASEEIALPRGRWFKVEQEVVLNAAQRDSGLLNVFIDGRLALAEKNATFRQSPAVTITGVAAAAAYVHAEAGAPDGRRAELWLSPLEIRWR